MLDVECYSFDYLKDTRYFNILLCNCASLLLMIKKKTVGAIQHAELYCVYFYQAINFACVPARMRQIARTAAHLAKISTIDLSDILCSSKTLHSQRKMLFLLQFVIQIRGVYIPECNSCCYIKGKGDDAKYCQRYFRP